MSVRWLPRISRGFWNFKSNAKLPEKASIVHCNFSSDECLMAFTNQSCLPYSAVKVVDACESRGKSWTRGHVPCTAILVEVRVYYIASLISCALMPEAMKSPFQC